MNAEDFKTFCWRTGVNCALVVDYFLYATGNPSVTYSFTGAYLAYFTWIIVAVITLTYGSDVLTYRPARRYFVAHVVIVGLLFVTTVALAGHAAGFAERRMEGHVMKFVQDPLSPRVEATDETRRLMIVIERQKYSMERETFTPESRRIDYLFKTTADEKYRLIMELSWKGTPTAFLHRVES